MFNVTCIDPFTKWAEAFPAPNKDAATVARIIVEQVICRFGTPLAIVTDRAKELDGDTCVRSAGSYTLTSSERQRIRLYNKETNAAAERFHRTLNRIIGKMIDENQRDWDSLLPYVMAAYRSSRHEAAQFTPNNLMLGREVRAPIDIVYGSPETTPKCTYDDYADELQHLHELQDAYTHVREHLQEAAQRSKRYYACSSAATQCWRLGFLLQPTETCWFARINGAESSLDPFLVVAVLGPVNLKLQRSRRAKPFVTHVDKVKPYLAEKLPKLWIDD